MVHQYQDKMDNGFIFNSNYNLLKLKSISIFIGSRLYYMNGL